MELQIQDLVTSIRKEGIDAAHEQAETIISEAREKAEAIITKAKNNAQAEKENADKDIALLKDRAMVSIDQAKRDAMLAFKNEVRDEFEKLLNKEVRKTLSGDALAELIKVVLTGEDESQYAVEVKEISDGLWASLADEIRNGLTIRPVKGISAGFRLAEEDGSGYFDCSDEEIMQMLMPYFRNLDI